MLVQHARERQRHAAGFEPRSDRLDTIVSRGEAFAEAGTAWVVASDALREASDDAEAELARATARRCFLEAADRFERAVALTNPTSGRQSPAARAKALTREAERLAPKKPKKRPCLPNRKAFAAFVHRYYERRASSAMPEAATVLRALWRLLEIACETDHISEHHTALSQIDAYVGGHGVAGIDERRRGGRLLLRYINMGDPYTVSIVFDVRTRRYRVIDLGAVIGSFDRRYPHRLEG